MGRKKTAPSTVRIRVIFILILLVGIVLTSRLYMVQVVYSEKYRSQADDQYVRPNHNIYDRGRIFFTDKNGEQIPAAMLQTGFVVAIKPVDVIDPEHTFERLSSVLDLDKEKFLARARKTDDPYEVIAERVGIEDGEKIAELDLSGVTLARQRWRYYPGDEMAAHSLGFVAYKGDELGGRYGLERQYENVLKRSDSKLYVNFFAEVFSNIKEKMFSDSSLNGHIVTGLEPNVQAQLEKQLKTINEEWSSRYSGGIIMDPDTGQVYALATSPAFNPNNRVSVSDPRKFSNPLVERVYEFGSIVKPITMAIGLDTGAVTRDSTYVDEGTMKLDGYTIANYDGQARGRVDMQEVLNKSLNTGAAYVALKVGNDRFTEQLSDFLVGERTGIDLPNETSGITGNLESARDIEVATASFGQGIAMNPVVAARALAALANGGTLVTPHIGKHVEFDIGGSRSLVNSEKIRVISTTTSKTITRMLVTVVDEALANGAVDKKHHSIAAKTGTAQISKDGGGGYYDDRYLHSFFGYAPAYDPEFIVFLYTVEPKNVTYASQTLTDPFMNIMDFLINYYEIPPDR